MRYWTCITLALGVLAAAPSGAERRALELEWIDVEGGAATLIVTPAGETVLVDSGWPGFDGRDAARIKAALERRKLSQIDHLITTHYHRDHFGGVSQLAAAVPIKRFYDHGPMEKLDEDPQFAKYYAEYRAAAKDKTVTLKPGDAIGLKQAAGPKLSLTILAARGLVAGGPPARQNAACAKAVPKAEDPSDNARSVVFVLKYGAFDFFDAGDLTWNVEAQLVCPADRVGPVDLYQVTHHGLDTSNNTVLLETLQPTVAVMNNGPKKGGSAQAVKDLKALPSLQALYAVHRNVSTTPADNADPELTANLEAEPDQAFAITAAVDAAARSFTVTNGRTGQSKTFSVK